MGGTPPGIGSGETPVDGDIRSVERGSARGLLRIPIGGHRRRRKRRKGQQGSSGDADYQPHRPSLTSSADSFHTPGATMDRVARTPSYSGFVPPAWPGTG